jgi:site-specific DNA-methyltransferase (adenine-specific)
MTLHTGDCLDVMAAMEPESVDAIVTDPPYGLEFMGKEWDKLGRGSAAEAKHGQAYGRTFYRPGWGQTDTRKSTVESQAWHQQWAEAAYRVAKPSAYLLAFGGTRTVHRMTVALEDAGWIIRDMLVWAYASGFPKSKASLKPAWEPIVMARKPGPLRDLAIDACRIGYVSETERAEVNARVAPNARHRPQVGGGVTGSMSALGERHTDDVTHPSGRWPANVILTDSIFDGGIEGVVGGGVAQSGGNINGRPVTGYGGHWADSREFDGYQDSGTYSRFFLIPKADRADREPVLGGLPTRVVNITEGHGLGPVNTSKGGDGIRENRPRANVHPTVKPVDLMRHLVRLVTPPGGTVLDPFLGSGTTAIAAEMEGFPWIGIEREAEYVAIAEARLNGTQRGLGIA